MSDPHKKPNSQYKSCLDCKSDILQKNPDKCPYCGSTNLTYEEEQLANSPAEAELENVGNYKKVAGLVQSNIADYFAKLKQILDKPVYRFGEATLEQIPTVSGVYVVYDNTSNQMIYVGTSKNLRVSLLQHHKKGDVVGCQFRKKIGEKHNLQNEAKISKYINDNCSFKLLEVKSYREMVGLECFITATMFPILNTEKISKS